MLLICLGRNKDWNTGQECSSLPLPHIHTLESQYAENAHTPGHKYNWFWQLWWILVGHMIKASITSWISSKMTQNNQIHKKRTAHTPHNIRSRDSVVSMLTRLQVGRSEGRIPAEVRDVSLPQNVETGSGVHPASCSRGIGVLRLRHEVDHSPTSCAAVKNEWRYTPLVLRHCVNREKCIFRQHSACATPHDSTSNNTLIITSIYNTKILCIKWQHCYFKFLTLTYTIKILSYYKSLHILQIQMCFYNLLLRQVCSSAH
jgi:hypothetical protein